LGQRGGKKEDTVTGKKEGWGQKKGERFAGWAKKLTSVVGGTENEEKKWANKGTAHQKKKGAQLEKRLPQGAPDLITGGVKVSDGKTESWGRKKRPARCLEGIKKKPNW